MVLLILVTVFAAWLVLGAGLGAAGLVDCHARQMGRRKSLLLGRLATSLTMAALGAVLHLALQAAGYSGIRPGAYEELIRSHIASPRRASTRARAISAASVRITQLPPDDTSLPLHDPSQTARTGLNY